MQAVCVKCSCEYRCKKNEVTVEELDVDCKSFRAQSGDLWECPGCGHELVTGFGSAIPAYDERYAGFVKYPVPLVRIFPSVPL